MNDYAIVCIKKKYWGKKSEKLKGIGNETHTNKKMPGNYPGIFFDQ
jgi:hypothetical protein